MCVLRRRPVTIIPANIARLSRLPQSSLLSPTLPAADAAAAATVESKLMMMVIRRRNFGKCSPSARDHLSIYLSIRAGKLYAPSPVRDSLQFRRRCGHVACRRFHSRNCRCRCRRRQPISGRVGAALTRDWSTASSSSSSVVM